jgi:serine/threonine protein phosphatase PrpC
MKGFGVTDKGKVRRENQDSYVLHLLRKPEGALVVVCDGMGGARAGGIASSIAAERFAQEALARMKDCPELTLAEIAREAAVLANAQVFERSRQDPDCKGMGTTLVAALVRDGKTVVINAGDSRAYLLREGNAQRITRDHSLVEDLVDAGELTAEQAQRHPKKNLITRALGVERHVPCDIFEPALAAGDTLMLCSDGLSNQVDAQEMAEQRKKSKTVNDFCKRLLKTALERGAPDNVTVAAIQL